MREPMQQVPATDRRTNHRPTGASRQQTQQERLHREHGRPQHEHRPRNGRT